MKQTKDQKLSALYQHLCDSQDLAESAGELVLMDKIQQLRYDVDRIRFAQ